MRTNPWFESVAEAQRRAEKRLPSTVYGALVAGSERGRTIDDNIAAFAELGFAPRAVGHHAERDLSTTVLGVPTALPVLISPTGVQAVDPEGEVAVARAAAGRGVIMGLSSFASRPVEEVTAANSDTFFQMYWSGSRDAMEQLMDRARTAGAKALIVTLDWSFSHGRDWGSPPIPERLDLRTALRFAPDVLPRPRWLWRYARTGRLPDLTVPNLAEPGQPVMWFNTYPADETRSGPVTDPRGYARFIESLHRDDPLDNARILAGVDEIDRHYPIYDMPELPHWSKGRVLLMGDAAHAVAPHSGQGASMAIEDALVLSAALEASDSVETAFARFFALRQERTQRVIAIGRMACSQKHAQSWLQLRIRDLLLPLFMPMGVNAQESIFRFRVDQNPLAQPAQ